MSFSAEQLRSLQRNVPAASIRTRTSGTRELSYVEGWYAIATANRIFGFDGWDRETLEARCVVSRDGKGSALAIYVARVRVTVRIGDRQIVRDGHGTGEGRSGQPGEAHDFAIKAAETDATKRALVTFGKAFGLSLYGGSKGRRPAVRRPDAATSGQDPGPEAALSARGNGRSDDFDQGYALSIDARAAGRADASVAEAALAVSGVHQHGQGMATPEAAPAPTFVPSISGGLPHRVDKAALTFAEPRRVRDKEHLRFVAAQPCLLCSATPCDAHHVRLAQPRALGRKVGDAFTVPLCREHHRELHHAGNEAAWWHDMGIDAIEVAESLWRETVERQ